MNSSSRLWPLATLLALALIAPAGAVAQSPTKLPVGEAKGVRLLDNHGGLVLVFSHRSAKLRERINSGRVWISCTNLGEDYNTKFGGNLDVSARGRVVGTGFGRDGADYCRLYVRSHTVKRGDSELHLPRRVLVSIALSQTGAVFLDEERGTLKMITAGIAVEAAKDKLKLSGYPTYAQILQAYPQAKNILVGLAAPGDAPPPKRVGYYGDGQEHIVLATLSTLGKRLFYESSAGDVFSTNVAVHLFNFGKL
jgi:hypothetical protein